VVVLNKADLNRQLDLAEGLGGVAVSSITGSGIEDLKEAIERVVWSGRVSAEQLQVTVNARHAEALRRAREATERAASGLDAEEGLELVALDLRIAAGAVGEIVGKTTTDDLLDAIFSQFCLGK
jgi:tRNA modification GTPase